MTKNVRTKGEQTHHRLIHDLNSNGVKIKKNVLHIYDRH